MGRANKAASGGSTASLSREQSCASYSDAQLRSTGTKTYQWICMMMPICLAKIVEEYLTPRTKDDDDVAFSGYWELCLRITDWNEGLYGACKGNHFELAQLMIAHGADYYDFGLGGACYGGHIELVRLMIAHGANNYNLGLRSACEGGHISIAQLMITYGANNWNEGLSSACFGDQIQLMRLMITNGATECDWCSISPKGHIPVI